VFNGLKCSGEVASQALLQLYLIVLVPYLSRRDLLRAAASSARVSHRCKQFAYFAPRFCFTLISRRRAQRSQLGHGASSPSRPTARPSKLKTCETFAGRLATKFPTDPWTKLHHYTRNPPGLLPTLGRDSPRTDSFRGSNSTCRRKPPNLTLAEAQTNEEASGQLVSTTANRGKEKSFYIICLKSNHNRECF